MVKSSVGTVGAVGGAGVSVGQRCVNRLAADSADGTDSNLRDEQVGLWEEGL